MWKNHFTHINSTDYLNLIGMENWSFLLSFSRLRFFKDIILPINFSSDWTSIFCDMLYSYTNNHKTWNKYGTWFEMFKFMFQKTYLIHFFSSNLLAISSSSELLKTEFCYSLIDQMFAIHGFFGWIWGLKESKSHMGLLLISFGFVTHKNMVTWKRERNWSNWRVEEFLISSQEFSRNTNKEKSVYIFIWS